jgi:hypothetical protein
MAEPLARYPGNSHRMSVNQESNPLLEIRFRIPFDRIRSEAS